MGLLYETLSCVPAYARRWAHEAAHARERDPVRIQFGRLRHQAVVVYEPSGKARDVTVAYLHGGAYAIGDPDSMGQVADMFTSHGYRFASIGFALVTERKFPAQIDDVFSGLACLEGYLVETGAPHRLCIGGSSAGGHAAAVAAYGRRLQEEHGFDASCLVGCLSLAGVMDLDDMAAVGLRFAGGTARFVDMPATERRDRAKVHAALAPFSPIQLLDESSRLPFFAVHGQADRLSPYASELAFVQKLNALAGEGTAVLHTMEGWSWQHMKLTVALPIIGDAAATAARDALFSWLENR